MSSALPPHDRPSRVEILMNTRSDDDKVVWVALQCHYPSQPLITSRICHIFLEDNPDIPDAPESKIVHWDVDFYDPDADLEGYREALFHFVDDQVIPQLVQLPASALLYAPRDPTFIASTIDGVHGRTTRIQPGLPSSLQKVETMCLRRIKEHAMLKPDAVPDAPIYDIDTVLVLGLFDTGSRSIMRVLLPDQTVGVLQWIPTVYMLLSPADVPAMAAGTLHEMQLLRALPPHPHVVGPPIAYVSRAVDGAALLCGFALRFLPGGTVRDVLDAGGPVALARRAKWAAQLASALRHVHGAARTYHGDVKLDNAVLDGNDDAVLIDFEQGRANEDAAAPELLAGCAVTQASDGTLEYHRPEDQGGEELPRLARRPYPYDAWLHAPRAIEAAEVHAFGVALASLFEEDKEDGVSAVISRCRAEDPNKRPTLEELETFFREWLVKLST